MAERPQTRFATVQDGSQIAFQVLGEGPIDLVYLTGAISHVDFRWENIPMTRFVQRMASFSRVILFHRRGVGGSDRVPAERAPTWEEWAEDLRAVLDAAGSQNASIFAVVDSGLMAIAFAATYPERTQALVLFNTAARRRVADDYPYGLPDPVIDFLASAMEKMWGTEEYAAAAFPSAANDPDELAWLAKYMRASATPRASAAQFRVDSETDVRSVLPSVRAPTLVLHRRELASIPIEAGRYLAEHIAGARLFELSGRDGGPQLEDVDRILTETEEFLTGVRPPTSADRFLATVVFTDIVDSTRLANAAVRSVMAHVATASRSASGCIRARWKRVETILAVSRSTSHRVLPVWRVRERCLSRERSRTCWLGQGSGSTTEASTISKGCPALGSSSP